MDTATISALTLLIGAWSVHGRPIIAGTLLTVATIIAGSSVWVPLLRQAM